MLTAILEHILTVALMLAPIEVIVLLGMAVYGNFFESQRYHVESLEGKNDSILF